MKGETRPFKILNEEPFISINLVRFKNVKL